MPYDARVFLIGVALVVVVALGLSSLSGDDPPGEYVPPPAQHGIVDYAQMCRDDLANGYTEQARTSCLEAGISIQ